MYYKLPGEKDKDRWHDVFHPTVLKFRDVAHSKMFRMFFFCSRENLIYFLVLECYHRWEIWTNDDLLDKNYKLKLT